MRFTRPSFSTAANATRELDQQRKPTDPTTMAEYKARINNKFKSGMNSVFHRKGSQKNMVNCQAHGNSSEHVVDEPREDCGSRHDSHQEAVTPEDSVRNVRHDTSQEPIHIDTAAKTICDDEISKVEPPQVFKSQQDPQPLAQQDPELSAEAVKAQFEKALAQVQQRAAVVVDPHAAAKAFVLSGTSDGHDCHAPSGSGKSQTSASSSAAFSRRILVRDLAYRAIQNGCHNAQDLVNDIAAARSDPERKDVTIELNGVIFPLNSLGETEWSWIARVRHHLHLQKLEKKKILSCEDVELVAEQFFPPDDHVTLKEENFRLVLENYVRDEAISRSYMKTLLNLRVTLEEIAGGAHFDRSRHLRSEKPLNPLLFRTIPERRCPERTLALNRLAEAALYGVPMHEDVFYANAPGRLEEYIQAWEYSKKHSGAPLPSSLKDYLRCWTPSEERILCRAKAALKILHMYEPPIDVEVPSKKPKPTLHDFGILKAVRATFFPLEGQSYWNIEDLESFLYARVTGSGLRVAEIPELMMLHGEFDQEFQDDATLRDAMRTAFWNRAEEFERDESERLADTENGCVKAKWWRRIRNKVKTLFGCGLGTNSADRQRFQDEEVAITPFNPWEA